MVVVIGGGRGDATDGGGRSGGCHLMLIKALMTMTMTTTQYTQYTLIVNPLIL